MRFISEWGAIVVDLTAVDPLAARPGVPGLESAGVGLARCGEGLPRVGGQTIGWANAVMQSFD